MWYGKISPGNFANTFPFCFLFSVNNLLNFVIYNNTHTISHKLSFYLHFRKSDDAALSYIAHILQIKQVTQITKYLNFTLVRNTCFLRYFAHLLVFIETLHWKPFYEEMGHIDLHVCLAFHCFYNFKTYTIIVFICKLWCRYWRWWCKGFWEEEFYRDINPIFNVISLLKRVSPFNLKLKNFPTQSVPGSCIWCLSVSSGYPNNCILHFQKWKTVIILWI